MKRKSRPPRERARLFQLHGGICHMCGQKVQVNERWELSHVIEWELTHDDSDENVKPAHYACHRTYTNTDGNPMVAKTLRLERKHLGIKSTQKSKWPTGRDTKFKSKIGGGVVPRDR